MPKGVEHAYNADVAGTVVFEVNFPLMPKGVEHLEDERENADLAIVNFPLMPKGVEHLVEVLASTGLRVCEFSIDAERR